MHLVSSDGWYLSFFREQPAPIDEETEASLAELRAAITTNGVAWMALLAGDLDPEQDHRARRRLGIPSPLASASPRRSTTAPITGARSARR